MIVDLLRASPKRRVLTFVGLSIRFIDWPQPVELQYLRELEVRGFSQGAMNLLSLLRAPGWEALLQRGFQFAAGPEPPQCLTFLQRYLPRRSRLSCSRIRQTGHGIGERGV